MEKPNVYHFGQWAMDDPSYPLEVREPFVEKSTTYQFHSHDFSELVFVLEGEARNITETGSYAVRKGDVFLTRPGFVHAYEGANQMERQVVMFDESLLEPFEDLKCLAGYHSFFRLEPQARMEQALPGHLRLGKRQLTVLHRKLESIRQRMRARSPGFRSASLADFVHIVIELSLLYEGIDLEASRDIVRLGEILSYLELHYTEEHSNSSLAQRLSVSPSHFNRLFRAATGKSPIDYLIRIRIRKSTELLRMGSTNITEAGFAVGFNDSNYFSRQFRRVMGQSPRSFVKSTSND